MPVQYSGIIEEHNCVRSNVGVFDVSHMGRIEIRGPTALQLIQRLTSNDVSKLNRNQIQYSLMCYPHGGIVDDITVYKIEDDRLMLCVNAINTDKDLDWIKSNNKENADVIDLGKELCQLSIQGKRADEVLQRLSDIELSSIRYFWFKRGTIDGVESIISRTGYTGEDGFEIYFNPEEALQIWEAIFNAGEEFGIKPAGLGARDTLRIEMKYSLYGNDIDSKTTPFEAGLDWVVKLHKKDFIGKEVLLKQKAKGVDRKLIGFETIDRGIPRSKNSLYYRNLKVGNVTSGTMSPSLKKPIGIGYVNILYSDIGTSLDIEIRGKRVKAKIVWTPFYSTEVKRIH